MCNILYLKLDANVLGKIIFLLEGRGCFTSYFQNHKSPFFYIFLVLAVDNKKQILNIGALEHLIRLISHEDKVVKRNAAMCLGTVATEGILHTNIMRFNR